MKILIIVAHPDDPEFFAGGAIAKWAALGHSIRYVIVTGGDKGNDDPTRTIDSLIAMREVEQRNAAAVLGVHDIVFLHHKDGELANTLSLQREIVRELRHFEPELVVTTDHETVHHQSMRINHNDHRVTGLAVCDAIFPASGNRMFFPELLAAGHQLHTPKELWFTGPIHPNHLLDVTEQMETKCNAIRAHVSQVKDPDGVSRRVCQGSLRILADGSAKYMETYRRVML